MHKVGNWKFDLHSDFHAKVALVLDFVSSVSSLVLQLMLMSYYYFVPISWQWWLSAQNEFLQQITYLHYKFSLIFTLPVSEVSFNEGCGSS